MDVGLERSSRNWRGRVVVHLVVPTKVSYSVDLAEIHPEHIQIHKKDRVVIVKMPLPHVEDVTPILGKVKTVNTCKWARFKGIDKPMLRELENTMLKEDYLSHARQVGETNVEEVRKQGGEVLRVFLQRLVDAACPGMQVVVE
jgi:hypothetical protein